MQAVLQIQESGVFELGKCFVHSMEARLTQSGSSGSAN
jgi:hypothetical protein